MKINQKILSIPPYVSTSWKNVVSLHVEERQHRPFLLIGLVNGSSIEIPDLDPGIIESIFEAHERHVEQAAPPKGPSPSPFTSEGGGTGTIFSFPLPIPGIGGEIGNLFQHNPEAADTPDLPKEMLEKVSSLTKSMGLDADDQIGKPEPHCNCMHCQIVRAMGEEQAFIEEDDEEVSDADLKFREWDIDQEDIKRYLVSNPFNKSEQYTVYLGSPVGCTCGKQNCEHIQAVLNS